MPEIEICIFNGKPDVTKFAQYTSSYRSCTNASRHIWMGRFSISFKCEIIKRHVSGGYHITLSVRCCTPCWQLLFESYIKLNEIILLELVLRLQLYCVCWHLSILTFFIFTASDICGYHSLFNVTVYCSASASTTRYSQ